MTTDPQPAPVPGARPQQPPIDWVALSARIDVLDGDRLRDQAAWINPPPHARVLDAGCGTGGLLGPLAAAAPTAAVTGLDADPRSLEIARTRTPHVALVQGDVLDASTAPGPFDVVIARSMVHHLPDQVQGIRALAARLAPGGALIFGEGGLATTALPFDLGRGAPGLEGRLRVAADAWFARMRASIPDAVPFVGGWARAIEAAGLHVTEVRTFLDEQPPPVDTHWRTIVGAMLGRYLNDEFGGLVGDDDRATLRWLLDTDNPEGIAQRTDLHLLGAQTLWRCAVSRVT